MFPRYTVPCRRVHHTESVLVTGRHDVFVQVERAIITVAFVVGMTMAVVQVEHVRLGLRRADVIILRADVCRSWVNGT